MKFKFSLGFKEYFAIYLTWQVDSLGGIAVNCIFPCSAVVLLGLILVGYHRVPNVSELSAIIFGLGFTPIIGAITLAINLRRNKIATDPINFEVDESGVSISGAVFNTHLTWDAITRVKEKKRYFFFYLAQTGVQVLPKDAIGSIKQVEEFRSFLLKIAPAKFKLQI